MTVYTQCDVPSSVLSGQTLHDFIERHRDFQHDFDAFSSDVPGPSLEEDLKTLSAEEVNSLSLYEGDPNVLGATYSRFGTNFSILAQPSKLQSLELEIVSEDGVRRIPLSRTGDDHEAIFSVGVKNLPPGTRYRYRAVDYRGDEYPLLDPRALALDGKFWKRDEHRELQYNVPYGVVVDLERTRVPMEPRVQRNPTKARHIYEVHVSISKEIPDEFYDLYGCPEWKGTQGTVRGLASPVMLAYFDFIGVDTLQIMPLQEGHPERTLAERGEDNVWNYNNASFLALKQEYFYAKTAVGQIQEIRETLSRLRHRGHRVLADVVWGHSSEREGLKHSWKVLAPDIFYHRDSAGNFIDTTNCGHTIDFNSPHVQQLAEDAARYFIEELGFDGLRIDQNNVCGRLRGEMHFDPKHPFLVRLSEAVSEFRDTDTGELIHPVLEAEPTDAGKPQNEFRFEYQPIGLPEHFHPQVFLDRDLWGRVFLGSSRYRHGHFGEKSTLWYMWHASMGWPDLFQDREFISGARMAALHDGMTSLDRARAVIKKYRTLASAFGIEHHVALDDELAVKIARAYQAAPLFSRGNILTFQGDEQLKAREHNHDPFHRPDSVILDWDPNPSNAHSHENFYSKMIRLRRVLPPFQDLYLYGPDGIERRFDDTPPGKITWYDALGKKYDFQSFDFESIDTRRENFLASEYSYIDPHGEMQKVLTLCYGNSRLDAFRSVLPRLKEGEAWELLFNSANIQNPFSRALIDNPEREFYLYEPTFLVLRKVEKNVSA